MSLLNDVLRDLHQREMNQREPVITPAALRGGNHQQSLLPGKKLIVTATLMCTLAGLLAFCWWFGWWYSPATLPADAFSSARAPVKRDNPPREPAQSSELEFTRVKAAQGLPPTLAKVKSSRDKEVSVEEPPKQLTRKASGTIGQRSAAVKVVNSGNTVSNDLLAVNSGDVIGRQVRSRQADIRLSTNPEAVVNRQLIKAQQIYQQGRPREAEQILRQSLALKSDADQVRHQLGSWMLARSAYQEVLNLLAGVDVSSSPSLRGLKAHASHALGRSSQALALLQTNIPPVNGNRSYHSLRAGLLQQNGLYQEALPIYAELVEEDPGKGEFWAGLAISLEQTGHLSPAMRAYRRALSDPGLNPKLVQYAEQRLLNNNQRGEL